MLWNKAAGPLAQILLQAGDTYFIWGVGRLQASIFFLSKVMLRINTYINK